MKIYLDLQYPKSPPEITFLTKVYHPNISAQGMICIDVLNEMWCPALTIEKCLISIVSLLDNPGMENLSHSDIAKLCLRDKTKYYATVRKYMQEFASWSRPSDKQVARLWEGF